MSLKQIFFTIMMIAIQFAQAEPPKAPPGYRDGKPDATYGTYNSVMSPAAKKLQQQIIDFEKRAFGAGALIAHNSGNAEQNMQAGKYLYGLEIEGLSLFKMAQSPELGVSTFERNALASSSLRGYKLIRAFQENLFEDMVRYIDIQIPGPNGVQSREEFNGERESLYQANYRTDKPLTDSDRKSLYQKRVQEFESEGGKLSEMSIWNPEMEGKKSGGLSYYEYVVRRNNQIWVTEGKAGHVLLAEGGQVKSAGQLVILKNDAGRIILVIASNASGNYKPDLYSAEMFGRRVAREAKISESLLVVTKGEPISTQTVKIYMKGLGRSKEEIKAVTTAMEQQRSLLTTMKFDPNFGLCGKLKF